MKLAVLSDLHANARALEAALALARQDGFDRLVLLGDLLTYGVDPSRTLALVDDAIANDGAALIVGNHDQLYLDLSRGGRAYYDKLPGWIRESADFTLAHLDATAFAALPWRPRVEEGPLLLAHANPYPVPDWRYLNQPEELVEAAAALSTQGMSAGVFGHTHRAQAVAVEGGRCGEVHAGQATFALGAGAVVVANAGSVGQPRDADNTPTFLSITLDDDTLTLRWHTVDYDAAAHRRDVEASALSDDTKRSLLRYFP